MKPFTNKDSTPNSAGSLRMVHCEMERGGWIKEAERGRGMKGGRDVGEQEPEG